MGRYNRPLRSLRHRHGRRARIDFTLSSATTYEMKMTPLDNPMAAVVTNGSLSNPATTTPIDWIEFQFFNTPSTAGSDTDFFIKSMQILAAPPAVPGDYSRNGTVDAADYVVWRDRLGTNFQLFNEVSGVTPGMVTAEDYTAWKTRFGRTSGAGSRHRRGISRSGTEYIGVHGGVHRLRDCGGHQSPASSRGFITPLPGPSPGCGAGERVMDYSCA